MNWKKRGFAATALGAAIVLGAATSAFAEGPHYGTHTGNVSGHSGACAYNWVEADTTGFPGWTGKHVFVAGMTSSSAALITVGCYPQVETTYVNTAGAESHTWAAKQKNGAFETAIAASNYKSVAYTEMWVTNGSSMITGTYLQVSPSGTIISRG